METHRSGPFKRTLARPHILVLVKDRASEDWFYNIPVGDEEVTRFCFINTGLIRNMLRMDIRQGGCGVTNNQWAETAVTVSSTNHITQVPITPTLIPVRASN